MKTSIGRSTFSMQNNFTFIFAVTLLSSLIGVELASAYGGAPAVVAPPSIVNAGDATINVNGGESATALFNVINAKYMAISFDDKNFANVSFEAYQNKKDIKIPSGAKVMYVKFLSNGGGISTMSYNLVGNKASSVTENLSKATSPSMRQVIRPGSLHRAPIRS